MLFKIVKYLGIFLIIAFCVISSFIATNERDFVIDQRVESKFKYASLFEDRFFDLRMKLTLDENKKDKNMVLVSIDDESLNKIGRWPWSRTKIVDIVNKLKNFGAKIVAFDVFFSEPEMICNQKSPDIELSESFKNFQSIPGNKILLPYSVDAKYAVNQNNGMYLTEIPEQFYFNNINASSSNGLALQSCIISKSVFPIKQFIDAEVDLGHIETSTDSDGVFRHYQLVSNVETLYLPSFALKAYEEFTGDKVSLDILPPGMGVLKTKKGTLDLNSKGETKVRWLGDLRNFDQVNAYSLLKAKNDDQKMKDLFKNKVVFLGSTAFGGAHDLRNTPIDSLAPGVLFHMNMLHMLIEGLHFVPENTSVKITWLMMAFATSLILFIMIFDNAILDFISINLILFFLYYIDTYYLTTKGYNVRLFFALLSPFLCYSWTTFLSFYKSNLEKRKIKGTFSRYLAPSIINDLLKNPDKLRLGGEKKNITVFFSDVRDFTSISEKLTPEQLTQCLNTYMTMMTDTLFSHNGTLDKYIGDAMVAYWGAPIDLENHAYWAIKASIEMIEKLPAINAQFEKDGFPIFKHGIGLNTGDCSVGNMGSNQIFSYTALGDNMNLGARLESLCKYYGVQLNVSEYTKNAIPENMQREFKFRTLDKVRVKGKENAVTIFEVLHPSHHLYHFDEELARYEVAFDYYQQKNFEKAKSLLFELHEKHPEDKSFHRLLGICEDFILHPPESHWDGTYTHKSK